MFDRLRERVDLTRDGATERAEELREQLRKRLFPIMGYNWLRCVQMNGLDNPFMTADARQVILNHVLRERQAPGRNRRKAA